MKQVPFSPDCFRSPSTIRGEIKIKRKEKLIFDLFDFKLRLMVMKSSRSLMPEGFRIDLTEEDRKDGERLLDILRKNGGVCLTDPARPAMDIKEELKKDPNIFTHPFCDYHGDVLMSAFIKKMLNEDCDE